MSRLTPARRRALEIVRDHDGVGASPFAELMWPDSKGHSTRSRRHSTPAGGAVGAGIKMRAGVFLGRLAREGLLGASSAQYASYQRRYHLTQAGRRALAEDDR